MLFDPSKFSPMNVKTLNECMSYLPHHKKNSSCSTPSIEGSTTPNTPSSTFDDESSSSSSLTTPTPTKLPISMPSSGNALMSMLLPRQNIFSAHRLLHRNHQRGAISPCSPSTENKTEEKTKTKTKPTTSCLVYLIRHGEASHNVLEKAAQEKAQKEAEAKGLSPEQVQECMEQARVAVLTDESLRDANLSVQGRQDALRARDRLNDLVMRHGLGVPSKVLVSPLTRTLETADLIFPNHETIHVREEIQERQTGKPCDCRRSASALATLPFLRRFQMESLRQQSILNNRDPSLSSSSSSLSDIDSSLEEDETEELNPASRRWKSDFRCDRPHYQELDRRLSDPGEEDKASLRVRTQKLLGLLDEPSIAVVTHKGYLRELERGTLGQANAEEFGNGEIRVYRIHLDAQQVLEKAERVV